MSNRVKITFEVELLTADTEKLDLRCDDMTEVIWDILDMQPMPVVDAVDCVTYKVERVKEGEGTTRYRKKPIEIEAVQFTGNNLEEIAKFMGVPVAGLQTSVDAVLRTDGDYRVNQHIHIPTLEGTMTANYGDWIIKGIKGEFYPCKSDIFKETYEEVKE